MRFLLFFCLTVVMYLPSFALGIVQDDSHPWEVVDVEIDGQQARALRTGQIADGETTTVTITFTDVSSIAFRIKSSTESYCDNLTIDIDGNQCLFTGETEWEDWDWDWGWSGDHVVTLTYAKDSSVSVGEDCCWIWFDGVDGLATGGDSGKNWDNDPNHPWIPNGNSMMSPYNLLDGESAWMSYVVEGMDSFGFTYCVSSEENSDFLVVSLDGQEVASFSGEAWSESYEITLPDQGRHVITWTYRKDTNGTSAGNDFAIVSFDGINAIVTDGYAMSLVYPWAWDDDFVALRSGLVPEGCATSISKTIKPNDSLWFTWKTSSEEGHDKLRCLVNGTVVYELSGETDWQYQILNNVNVGDVVTWEYVKDENGISVGSDCGWISSDWIGEFQSIMDYFPDDEDAEATASQNVALDLDTGRAAQRAILDADDGMAFTSGVERLCWHVDDRTGYANSPSSLRSGVVGEGEESWMKATVIGAGTVTFHWKVSSEAGGDILTCYVDGVEHGSVSGETEWGEVAIEFADDARHEIKWCYARNDNGLIGGDDCGWVDGLTWNAPKGWDDPDEPIVPASASRFIKLDLTPSPHVITMSKAPTNLVESITFSPVWSSAERVQVFVNGMSVTNATEEGSFTWTPSTFGVYEFRLSKFDDNGEKIEEDDMASFVVAPFKGTMILFQ